MTPLVVVALLADLARARDEARKAWAYADNEERVSHELHAQLDKMFDAGYDTGFADAAGIDVGEPT